MTLSLIDWIIVFAYFVIILYIGFVVSKKKEDKSNSTIDFLLAGRKVTLPLFIATLVATWYGNILGMGEFIYSSGVVAWVCFAFPYYIAAFLFAIFIAKKIRESGANSIPEQITMKFGVKAGWISSLIVLVITIPAAYVLMLGVMINLFSGWDLWISIIIGVVLSLAFLYSGGFRADVFTNTAQFVIMYFGFGVLLYFTVTQLGSFSEMSAKLPEHHKDFFGGLSWQYILSWYIISMQTFVDPGFHQRCAAAESPKTAKKGILISIIFWMIFDFLTLTTGLYAKAFFVIDNPLMAYPILGESLLPAVWKGLFVISLLATIMSTLDSYAFLSAVTIGNDILKPLKKYFKILKDLTTKQLIRIGLIITSIIAVIMAISLPSAVDLIYKTSSVAVPGLIIPLLVSFSKKFTLIPRNVIIIMLSSAGISVLWTILKMINLNLVIIQSTEPMIPGILLSIFLSLFFVKSTKVNYE
jgi:SSS family solute:Na+ symporter